MGQDGVTRRWEPEAKADPKTPGPDTCIHSQHPEPPWSSPQPGHSLCPLQAGQIDAVTLGGEDIYTAGRTFGLVPAAGERYARECRGRAAGLGLEVVGILHTGTPAPWAVVRTCGSPTVPLSLGWLLAAGASPSCPGPRCSPSVIGNLARVSEPANGHRVSTSGLAGHIQTLLPFFFFFYALKI